MSEFLTVNIAILINQGSVLVSRIADRYSNYLRQEGYVPTLDCLQKWTG